jgi:hypothetical protein
MTLVPSSTLTEEAAGDYMKMYQATVKLLIKTDVLFNELSKSSLQASDRELYRAKALEASRTLELLRSTLAAFEQGTSLVRRPTDEEIATAQGLAQKLAELAAAHAQAQALVKLVADGVDGFNKVNGTA